MSISQSMCLQKLMNIRRCQRQIFLQYSIAKYNTNMKEPATEYLKINDVSGSSRSIAYQKLSGTGKEGLLFIPGFLSYKHGTKATKLLEFSRKHSLTYVRYDPSGLGESLDLPLEEARFRHWVQDAEEVLMKVTDGKQVIVGSSMGGWIATYLATKHPEKFSKLILVAPALNFCDYLLEKFRKAIPPSLLDKFEKGETIWLKFEDYGKFPVSLSMMKSFNEYNFDFEKKINVDCPVKILHGMKDKDVPYEASLRLIRSLSTEDVKLSYFKDGDHSLSSEKFLKELYNHILSDG